MSLINPTSERQKQREVAVAQRNMALAERAMAPKLLKEYRRVGKIVAALVKQGVTSTQELMAAIPDHEPNIEKILQRGYSIIIPRSAQQIDDGQKSRFTLGHLRLEKKDLGGTISRLLGEWMQAEALEKSIGIGRTTRNIIKGELLAGAETGLVPSVLARNIVRKTGGKVGRARAILTARTESHSAMMSSQQAAIKELDLPSVQKEWVATTSGTRTRDSHRKTDGQRVDMDEKFNVNGHALDYPGDPSGPGAEVINCRCVLVYHTPQEDAA